MPNNCLLRSVVTTAGALLVSVLAAQTSLHGQTQPPLPDVRGFMKPEEAQIVARHVQGKVSVIAGGGSDVSVFAGDDGVLLVDDMLPGGFSQILLQRVRGISDKPIRYVINTHFHGDHTGGNEFFAKQGAVILSTDNLRIRHSGALPPGAAPSPPPPPPAGGRGGRGGFPAASGAALPAITYAGPVTIHMNGEDVLLIPTPRPSHTDGDTFVYFKGSDVIAMGDVYTTDLPAINPGNGGTVQGLLDDWNMALDRYIGPNTKIIPGHGQISTRADLIALRDAVITIHGRFQALVKQGMTLDQVKAARPTKEFDAKYALENVGRNEVVSTDQWYETMYNEVKAGR